MEELEHVVPTPPRQQTVANMVQPGPDVVTTVCVLLMMDESIIQNMQSCLQKYNKTVYSRILLDNY